MKPVFISGKKMKVSKARSFVKSLSYRIFGTLSSWVVVFIITGEGTLATLIALWETIVKVFIFYWHERGWNRIQWGRGV